MSFRPSPDEDQVVACLDGHSLNISELIRKMQLGLKVLGMGAIQANQKRRSDLKYKLGDAAKELADKFQPMGPFLFGDDIHSHYKLLHETNHITSMLVPPSPPPSSSYSHMTPSATDFSPCPRSNWTPGHPGPPRGTPSPARDVPPC